ncbi:hypothetical protein CAOG_00269 [Capsaspora owczarzaki ATCC 30864]|uniref:hypothetical protein n=1 Tax=Capsaspora owczarzaki (strain ATCC 30864) TaxID=595528 RepID=UPI0003520FCA|nr:hypothetical protein CAOG_00269 [Capsaspora owczarzaki ATCC 30864]|eukprot:XP_004365140.2 hypothetical protein CAOG_00269 [Capsaspora owczarzaki ATCC 30864]
MKTRLSSAASPSLARTRRSTPTRQQPAETPSAVIGRDSLVPWRKILYERQPVPDNFLPPTFLDTVQTNVHVRPYRYWSTVLSSLGVLLQICGVLNVLAIFHLLQSLRRADDTVDENSRNGGHGGLHTAVIESGWIGITDFGSWATDRQHTPMHAVAIALAMAIGAVSLLHRTRHGVLSLAWESAKSASLFIASLAFVLPVLFSLTDTISTDTIHAMAAVALILTVAVHDYSFNARNDRDGSFLVCASSLNTGMFACVCLASRLSSLSHVFVLVLFATAMFAFAPAAHARIESTVGTVVYTIGSCAITILLLMQAAGDRTSKLLVISEFAALTALICLVCPAWLVFVQRYKSELHGPWDEAIIGGILHSGQTVGSQKADQ